METKYEKIKEVVEDVGIGCALFALVAPVYLLGNAFYNTPAGEKTRFFLANFQNKHKKWTYFKRELKENNDEYEITLGILKDGGYLKEVEPCHINRWQGSSFFHKIDSSEKTKYVNKLSNLNKSRKNIEKKLFKF